MVCRNFFRPKMKTVELYYIGRRGIIYFIFPKTQTSKLTCKLGGLLLSPFILDWYPTRAYKWVDNLILYRLEE